MRLLSSRQNGSIILFLVLLLFVSHIAAQGLPKLPSDDDDDKKDDAATTTDAKDDSKDAKETATTTDKDAPKTTETSATISETKAPTKTDESKPGLSGLPKLKGQDYPPPTVPPTADAPFMKKQTVPEGTVFIAVGAALGFFGFMVLAWRGFLAWSVHRSVKRAANAHIAKYEGKDPLVSLKKKTPYAGSGPGSTLSLDQLGGMGQRRASKTNSAHTSLFFSPTAGAGAGGMQAPGNRGSGYLPAGYYASGNAAPAGGNSTTHMGGGVPMSNLANGNRRYSRGNSRGDSRGNSRGPTPPRSPTLPPSRGVESIYNGSRLSTAGLVGQPNNNSLSSLGVAPQGRAPSAYLEDLFSSHAPPQSPREETRERRDSRRM